MDPLTAPITMFLARMQQGDAAAANELMPLVYAELRGIAGRLLREGTPGHTLQPTALVHEAWLKIANAAEGGGGFHDRIHFLAVAARAMRQVLINHARDRRAQKRGGDAKALPLDACIAHIETQTGDIVTLHDTLEQFALENPRPARVVELRVFGGMSIEEVGIALGVGPTTVKADWRFARAWLQRRLPGPTTG
ncbi:MAG: sigma-70 family RNA polymerase sigma factor [Planctomycetes bacterium]|nr:sigma-70 family RNA polymerase sigma factor [Planctomycetota bacterium]